MRGPAGGIEDSGPIAIVCGGGALPAAVADSLVKRGRQPVLFAIKGWADPALVNRFPHHWIAIGQAGRFFRLAASEGCRTLVFIGTVVRPSPRQIRLDWRSLLLLPRVLPLFRGGDDRLLSGLASIIEEYGFRLAGAHEVAPEITMQEGPVGRLRPSLRDTQDIGLGISLLHAIGRFDIGQAAVVSDNQVLAVEAAEGTDQMLARIVELRRLGRIRTPVGQGVLVKAVKPGQDRRLDLPTIGPRTVTGVARAGLAGLAVVAGEALVAEPNLVRVGADRARLFVVGVRAEDFAE